MDFLKGRFDVEAVFVVDSGCQLQAMLLFSQRP